jgi:hypothetical protein
MLYEALKTNEFDLKIDQVTSPKIAIREEVMRRHTYQDKGKGGKKLSKAEYEKQ